MLYSGTDPETHITEYTLVYGDKRGVQRSWPRKRGVPREREFLIDNLLVRIHFITVMIRWTGRVP